MKKLKLAVIKINNNHWKIVSWTCIISHFFFLMLSNCLHSLDLSQKTKKQYGVLSKQ